jgi:hypothetical protein
MVQNAKKLKYSPGTDKKVEKLKKTNNYFSILPKFSNDMIIPKSLDLKSSLHGALLFPKTWRRNVYGGVNVT